MRGSQVPISPDCVFDASLVPQTCPDRFVDSRELVRQIYGEFYEEACPVWGCPGGRNDFTFGCYHQRVNCNQAITTNERDKIGSTLCSRRVPDFDSLLPVLESGRQIQFLPSSHSRNCPTG